MNIHTTTSIYTIPQFINKLAARLRPSSSVRIRGRFNNVVCANTECEVLVTPILYLSLSYKVDTKLTAHNTLVARECLIHGFNSSRYASKSIQFRNSLTKKYPIAKNQQVFYPKQLFLFQLFRILHYSITHLLSSKIIHHSTFYLFRMIENFRLSTLNKIVFEQWNKPITVLRFLFKF